jgi:cysteine desulfuration protein SufE
MTIDEIIENFEFLDDWEDRYRYVIELGRQLEPLGEADYHDANKVRGCASQVWLISVAQGPSDDPVMHYRGDSDAHIVRGLVAILIALYSGRRAGEIASLDVEPLFDRLGLREHLTPQRSNGLFSMVAKVRAEAAAALEKQH